MVTDSLLSVNIAAESAGFKDMQSKLILALPPLYL